uniref:Uncharacterized protein n=1 Tax=Arundo donax TaxID=35708 RepID=A0A0A8ZW33_ARUDO
MGYYCCVPFLFTVS